MTSTRSAATVRRRGLIWLGVALPVALLLGITWLAGGFERGGTPYLGRQTDVGRVIETRFWDIRINSALVPGLRTSLELELEVTNKTSSSAAQLTADIIVVRFDDGSVLRSGYCRPVLGMMFDPLVPSDATCTFRFESNEVDPPDADVPVDVIVLDQVMGPSLLMAPEPVADFPAGHVRLDVVVEDEW